jgi:hypothetical protein
MGGVVVAERRRRGWEEEEHGGNEERTAVREAHVTNIRKGTPTRADPTHEFGDG